MESINKLAHRYIQEEPEEALKEQVRSLLLKADKDESARAELENRLCCFLKFGTAGLRAQMQAGYSRFNLVTIAKAAYALGEVLKAESQSSKKACLRIALGFDARLNSNKFANECIAVLTGLGIEVHAFDKVVATPVLAYAVTHLKAEAGVMVTASHNPPGDNGFKVYGPKGAQIEQALEKQVETKMQTAPQYQQIPRLDEASQKKKNLVFSVEQTVLDSYFKRVKSSCLHDSRAFSDFPIVYTPMHGVGKKFAKRALEEAGFTNLVMVKNQAEPDGRFPTVAFPNPEEKGALDEALKVAKQVGADLILANDPDADRLAVVTKNPVTGEMQQLSGNEIGWLLGSDTVLNGKVPKAKQLLISTFVSSRMLSQIASCEGVRYEDTMTGFSNIAHQALRLESLENREFVFGYEEALGYANGNFVRDKDGVHAAVRFAELYASLKKQKLSVFDQLDLLYKRYGLFRTLQWSIRLKGLDAVEKISGLMNKLRQNEIKIEKLSDYKVDHKEDFLLKGNSLEKPADMLIYHAKDVRLVVRPSGTEPKMKFYLEIMKKLDKKDDVSHLKMELDKMLVLMKGQIEASF